MSDMNFYKILKPVLKHTKLLLTFDDLCDLESANCKWFNLNITHVFINV